MTVENVDYINDLDPSNPKGSDKISYGDDHIRNVKRALKETFPDITGPVTVDQDKLNEIPAQLPVAPTEEGSVLHNEGDVWSETTTLKIVGDKAFIPGLAGLGNLNLYVNNEGEIVASEIATDPTVQHDLEFHADVSYPAPLREDDILIYNGSEWVNTPNRTGNMFKPFEQNQSVGGGFSIEEGGWRSEKTSKDAGGYYNFTVPAGCRFALVSIKSDGGTGFGNAPDFTVDGVGITVHRYQSDWPSWSSTEECGPMVECKDKIRLKTNGAEGAIVINGYFFEE